MKIEEQIVGYIDPKSLELIKATERKARRRLKSASQYTLDHPYALKYSKKVVVKEPENPKYTDSELINFIETQLVRGMGWVPIWIDASHVQIVVARVGYANTYVTFRDAVSRALDERSETSRSYLPPSVPQRPKPVIERPRPQQKGTYTL